MAKKTKVDLQNHPTETTAPAEENAPKTVKPRKKPDFAQMGEQATQAASGINRSPLQEMLQTEEQRTQQTMPVIQIQPRPEGDTRPLHWEHLLALTESIDAWGLLEPIVLDKAGVLLAGGHRLAAYKLLSTPPEKRLHKLVELCPEAKRLLEDSADLKDQLGKEQLASFSSEFSQFENIPVRVLPFDATQEKDRALAIETAENTQRRDYTPKEVLGIYEQLLSVGYTDREGRPKRGEKQARPALATIIGKSIRTVRRMLNRKLNRKEIQQDVEASSLKNFRVAATRFKSSMDALRTALEKLPQKEKEVQDLTKALKLSHIFRKIKAVEDSFLSSDPQELIGSSSEEEQEGLDELSSEENQS